MNMLVLTFMNLLNLNKLYALKILLAFPFLSFAKTPVADPYHQSCAAICSGKLSNYLYLFDLDQPSYTVLITRISVTAIVIVS